VTELTDFQACKIMTRFGRFGEARAVLRCLTADRHLMQSRATSFRR